MKQLQITQVEKKFGKHTVFQKLDLQLDRGMFGLLGPNGAGKTTLMRIISTLYKPTCGELTYDGMKWSTQAERVQQVLGYLPQHFDVMPHFRAWELLDYIAQLKGLSVKKQRRQAIDELLTQVNLQEHAQKKVKTFSGGMRRRLGIAQALLGNPEILIIDEPTAGLDPEERIRFRNFIRKLALERIVILSTHIVEDIATTCRTVAVLHQGKLTKYDALAQLADVATGHVWLWNIAAQDMPTLNIDGEIISSTVLQDRIELRIWSKEQPNADAVLTAPNVEEGYISCIKG